MFRTIDLFAGAGGLTIGFEQAGFRTVAAVELDPYAAATLTARHPCTEVVRKNILDVDLSVYRGLADVVIGGPPCQPFSSGGLRAAHEDERDMLPAYLAALDSIRPEAFVMENVPGLATGERRNYLDRIVSEMSALGYEVDWQVLSAVDYGVPQKRRRLFVVGMHGGKFVFPSPTHGGTTGRPYVTVREALPKERVGEPNRSVVTYARKPDIRPSPFDGLMFNGGGRPIDLDAPAHTILASAGGNKTHFFDTEGVVPSYHHHLMEGGEPRVGVVPGTSRLTVQESAILQTFPEDMVFHCPTSARYRQVGNAVPPRLACAVASALAEQLAERNSAPTESFASPVPSREAS